MLAAQNVNRAGWSHSSAIYPRDVYTPHENIDIAQNRILLLDTCTSSVRVRDIRWKYQVGGSPSKKTHEAPASLRGSLEGDVAAIVATDNHATIDSLDARYLLPQLGHLQYPQRTRPTTEQVTVRTRKSDKASNFSGYSHVSF